LVGLVPQRVHRIERDGASRLSFAKTASALTCDNPAQALMRGLHIVGPR
jgi:hypothetical protein